MSALDAPNLLARRHEEHDTQDIDETEEEESSRGEVKKEIHYFIHVILSLMVMD